jgi:hypothetical protein
MLEHGLAVEVEDNWGCTALIHSLDKDAAGICRNEHAGETSANTAKNLEYENGGDL